MKTSAQLVCLSLVAAFLLAAGCGRTESKVPANRESAVEARNQMRTVRSQIKASGASCLREALGRGESLEKSGGEAMEARDYAKALSSFAGASKCYQQARSVEATMEVKREAALSAKKDVEAARSAANSAFKTDARPESFVSAGKTEKEADEALAREDFEKAGKLFVRAAADYKASQADADKLVRAELSRAARSAKQEAEAARSAASGASKPESRPAAFATAGNTEKEAEEALAGEEFEKARELFVRAADGYKAAKAESDQLNRADMSRNAYARKRDAEAERLTASAASKPEARPVSFVTAGSCMKEGEEALAREDFGKAMELFTRAADGYKAAQADAEKLCHVETARAAWSRQLAAADVALLERQAAAEFANVKSQAAAAADLAVKDPGQAAQQFVAATATLKEIIAQARTKENLPKAVPVVARLENALRLGDWLQSHRALGDLEQLVPSDPRMADFRAKAAALPWPKELTLDLGGGVTMNLIYVGPGSFSMGEGNERHQVTLTKPFYMGKFEVTQQQWQVVMGSNPSSNRNDKNPVENISWDASLGFVTRLNEKLSGVKVGLPTEAQWEYACRAGSSTKYCYGDSESALKEYAAYPLDTDWRSSMTRLVGTKKPNAWGFYDMHGNVAEFCSDWYGQLPAATQEDPQGPASGSGHVLRGGSCRDTPFFLTSVSRREVMSSNVLSNGGFRLVLVTDAIAGYQAGVPKLSDVPSIPAVSIPSISTPPAPAPSAPPASIPTASLTKPSTPSVMTAPMQPDDWMKGLPPRALPGFLQARADVLAGKGLMGMRSWRAMWGNRLRDPTRGYAELEFAGLLLSDPSKTASASVEEQKKQQNLKEASLIVRSIRARNVSDSGLLDRLEDMAKKLP